MTPLLEQFIAETREFLQGIGEKLMQLESAPDDAELMGGLFRLVHTLKGNSGLFDFPEMTRVLHAGEDLMDAVRNGRVAYSQELADQLLDAMDFVGMLCDEITSAEAIDASRGSDAVRLSFALRALIDADDMDENASVPYQQSEPLPLNQAVRLSLARVPEPERIQAFQRALAGETLYWVAYAPNEDCFFKGDDPFYRAHQTPGVLWGRIIAPSSWPPLQQLDAYRCVLHFELMVSASHEELVEYYRYVPDQINIDPVEPLWLVIPQGNTEAGPVYEDFVSTAMEHLRSADLVGLRQAALTLLQGSNSELWLSSALRWLLELLENAPDNRAALERLIQSLRTLMPPDWSGANSEVTGSQAIPLQDDAPTDEVTFALANIFAAQRQILLSEEKMGWQAGRTEAVAQVLLNCCKSIGNAGYVAELEFARQQALQTRSCAPLLAWLNANQRQAHVRNEAVRTEQLQSGTEVATPAAAPESGQVFSAEVAKFGRRVEDSVVAPKSLKVDQVKIDRLMDLIGEMVVSKNALPYLAQRAEDQFGIRELSREIKAQYAVINRIAEEMQDAIMQVRMMPVSFVFQRFPRLVRDISRKLGKEVQLVLEGEDTEADKNIIEALADPLIHIVRNSLDHGLEMPEVRRAAAKPDVGTLTIRAVHEGDQVLIEIIDDGKGIDPAIVKRKAYEKGIIDEAALERISDRDAVNLVFASGFSTAEVISDLSGRGVGMDVVRTAVEKVNGSIVLESAVGKGTHLRISLPLSMAVTKVMIVESDAQLFGVPMDHVVETVRVSREEIRRIKHSETTVLRGRIVGLRSLNAVLGLEAPQQSNADNEMAVLVVRVSGQSVGLVVDDFRETVDVIQKPLGGVLSGLSAYSGSALMGDGSVLMILNVKEVV